MVEGFDFGCGEKMLMVILWHPRREQAAFDSATLYMARKAPIPLSIYSLNSMFWNINEI